MRTTDGGDILRAHLVAVQESLAVPTVFGPSLLHLLQERVAPMARTLGAGEVLVDPDNIIPEGLDLSWG